MAVFYNAGEQKTRPGLYQRYVNSNFASQENSDARDGYCAIPIQASWGPLGKVVANSNSIQLQTNYGYGTYGAGYTVPAAAAMFAGGAATVYTYRLGTGGTKATKAIAGAAEGQSLTVTAKYEGTMPIAVAIQAKLGDSTKKTIFIYANSVQVESFDFTADSTNEGSNLIAAVANSQKFVSKELLLKVTDDQKKLTDIMIKILNEVYDAEKHDIRTLENKFDKLTKAVEGLMKNGNGQGSQKHN